MEKHVLTYIFKFHILTYNLSKFKINLEPNILSLLQLKTKPKKNIIIEKTWNGSIIANSFKEASSERNSKFGFKSFELAPDEYSLIGVLFDKDSKKNIHWKGN